VQTTRNKPNAISSAETGLALIPATISITPPTKHNQRPR
jgi:hypothetical protein